MSGKLLSPKYLAVLLLAVVFVFLLSFDAFSATEMSLGGADTGTLSAAQDIKREVVTYEPYETTCSREVYDGTRNECSPGRTERKCRKVSGVGEECWDETEQVCSDEPVYRTETYDCVEQRKVVNEVFDYSVIAKIDVIKTLRSKNYDLNNCKFGVVLSASSESYYASCLEAIVKVNVTSRTEVMNGSNKERAIKLDLDFADISGLNATKYGLENLAFSKGIVTFVTADLASAQNFKLNLKLTRNRFLLKDKVVTDRALKAGEYTLEKMADGRAKVSIVMSKIGVDFDSSKKHTLKIDLGSVKAVDTTGAINYPKLQNALTDSLVIND
ncbi:MAG: hypothetical protein H7281_12465 [Bacteriovorax sp.]|nr:hypothetical protein [Bacteriovorax sp.]